MARAALGWGVRDLAKQARISANTVARFEAGKAANASTITMIQQAFEGAGVRFTDTGGVEPPKKDSKRDENGWQQ
jgi:transcriptional regulator with XRE-family HTH domain